jgi:hypothetical protein
MYRFSFANIGAEEFEQRPITPNSFWGLFNRSHSRDYEHQQDHNDGAIVCYIQSRCRFVCALKAGLAVCVVSAPLPRSLLLGSVFRIFSRIIAAFPYYTVIILQNS